ncbi:MAG: 2-succinyl-5-enolpyruvyl-6-hydroxy-3-cyclohexene-1-carboxylic-acid synthase [Azonexus sp.]|nr:2-succinyl-5-enolpyruvyl-6-hydroxy-3-cyclohexene-1-carboxylic-acid synthase [Azonexus sp.]MBP6907501.1 2-succinyl-5-enolpyruvyl-6-hydroxy-3-cyclohexene-1-carboxylic-acid synthase [Azonexus sp.]
MDTASLNLLWSHVLVGGFAAAGVRRAVISPGSRSTPLALALLRHGAIACHVLVDERSAAFFALGLTKASGLPTLLLATSGSAPGHWLPAAIEADRAGVPLLLISADRPAELQGCGANQTIDQSGLFAGFLRERVLLEAPHRDFDPAWLHRLAARLVEKSLAPLAGPVHLNQAFREPLVPSGDIPPPPALAAVAVFPPSPPSPSAEALAAIATAQASGPGIIVCGPARNPADPDFPPAVGALARHLDCPILAEPLSGLRFGPWDRSRVCCRQDRWLRRTDFLSAHRPSWVLRFGDTPVGRPLQDYAARAPSVILVEPGPRWNDPAHAASAVVRADPTRLCQALAEHLPALPRPGWRAAFRAAEDEANAALARLALPAEARLLAALIAAAPPGCPVFVGNSLPIRDLDSFSGSDSKTLEFFANRGASGIDGSLSTAAGIAAARGPTLALLGDLAAQHDIGGLAALRGLPLVAVVIKNGGGGIFEHLPQARLPEFEAAWLTPQGIDLASTARAFGLNGLTLSDPKEFPPVLAQAIAAGGPCLIEVQVDRDASRAAREAWWSGSGVPVSP